MRRSVISLEKHRAVLPNKALQRPRSRLAVGDRVRIT